MQNKKIELNLGCGIVYKPQFINIDNFEKSVADICCKAENLPFKSNTIDTIEALHLIEHFDYIHCKYVLYEWFRVLKPDRNLIIETPDFDKSYVKFRSEDLEQQKSTLQWFYGIDSRGMQHKVSFTFKLLKELLNEIGFEDITKREQITHKYEHGIRLECKKPKDYQKIQFFSEFRGELLKNIDDDSDILISLENHCINEIEDIYYKEFYKNTEIKLMTIIAKSAVNNPVISLVFLKKCREFGLIKYENGEKKFEQLETIIKYLIDIEFHKKLFTLWKKSKKEIGSADENFKNFIRRMESLIMKIDKINYREQLKYITNLESENINVFNFHIVQLKARILYNKGVKNFHKKKYKKVMELLSESIKLNPENPIVYWNMARLGVIIKDDNRVINENYENAISILGDKEMLKEIKNEYGLFKNNKIELIPKEPISEFL